MASRTGLGSRPSRTRNTIPAGRRTSRIAVDDGAATPQQVPDQHLGVVGAGGQHAAAGGRPLHRVEGGAVAAQLQQRRARLAHVEDADQRRVRGEGGQQVGVVRGRREAQERRRVRELLVRGARWGERGWRRGACWVLAPVF